MLAKSKYTGIFIVVFIALINMLYANDEKNNILRLDWSETVPVKTEVNDDMIKSDNLLYDVRLDNPNNKSYFYIHEKTSFEDIKNSRLIKVNHNGVIKDDNIINLFPDKNESYKTNKIISTPDKGYLIIENSDSDLPVDFMVKKIDKDNNEEWAKKLQDNGNLIIITNVFIKEDSYIISGYIYDNAQNGQSKFCVYKLDTHGNIMYKTSYLFGGNFMPYKIIFDTNGNMFVCGTIYKDNTTDIWVASINKDGEKILWEKYLKDCSILGQSSILKNNCFAVAASQDEDSKKNKYRILVFDLNGSKLWEKIYTFAYNYENIALYNNESNYILFGNYYKDEDKNTTECHVTNLDSNGKVAWEEDVEKLRNKKIEDVKINDNQYIFAGTAKGLKDDDILWVAKFIARKYVFK
ncbi:MAG: hypothetical protein A2Y24_05110 [Clostridiales bacterium GWE2_32_10]|nr:MAG: hypothetical protein A2Y24_05110 [Clostridiales bacterium GWE2_32_10]